MYIKYSHIFCRPVGRLLGVVLFVLLIIISSCQKKDTVPTPQPSPENEENRITNASINQWIADTMRYYYYWNTSIPQDRSLNFNQHPEDFFEEILNRPADRFSWIQNAEDLKNELSGVIKTSGLEVSFFRIGDDGAGITVRFVHRGTPADAAGIKRGDIFTHVNGTALTVDSDGFVHHHEPLFGNETFSVTQGILDGNIISSGETISLTPIENFQENAIQMEEVITTDNGTKVAYLFYNRFLNQPQELVDAFVRFKASGATELIIDERYNGGGSVDIAGLLSALVHQNFDINSPFIQFDFNENFNDETLTYADLFGAVNAPAVAAGNLNLARVFILATGSSASASELLINNLKPFLGTSNVIHIGSTTYGKDEASTTFVNSSPEFEGENDWGIQPIILKYKNKDGVGDFEAGLEPLFQVVETIPFAPMGSSSDPLIAKALEIIDPSMQASLQRQMDITRRRHPSRLELLEKSNKNLSNPKPLDITRVWNGDKFELN